MTLLQRLGVKPSSSQKGDDFPLGSRRSSTVARATVQQALPPQQAQANSSKVVKAALDLKQRGWAIVEDVLSRDDCDKYVESLWNWIEGLGTGVSRDKPETWNEPAFPPSTRGIICSLGVAHEPFVWRVRKHPQLLQVFAGLWGTNELLSSFDSINALAPATEPPATASWLHTDQAPTRKGACCIQGLVNLVDVGPESTGTILIKDKSHLEHQRFFEEACTLSREEQQQNADWYQFRDAELPWFEQFDTVTPSAKAGSVFLWDSRLAHANVLPSKTERWRHVVYACYQPRTLAADADLALKKQAWDSFRVTTHWPAQNVALFPEEGTSFDGGERDNERRDKSGHRRTSSRGREEDDLCRRLAGVLPYPAEDVWQQESLLSMSETELQQLLARRS